MSREIRVLTKGIYARCTADSLYVNKACFFSYIADASSGPGLSGCRSNKIAPIALIVYIILICLLLKYIVETLI